MPCRVAAKPQACFWLVGLLLAAENSAAPLARASCGYTEESQREGRETRTRFGPFLLGAHNMRGSSSDSKVDFTSQKDARACFDIFSNKEFLVVATLGLVVCDLCDIYGNVIRVTGFKHLPFPGNVTAMYYTQIAELNWFDLIISVMDIWCVMCLSLAVCGEHLDGMVCSLCGFASSMILELVYVLWLSCLVFVDIFEEVRPFARLFFRFKFPSPPRMRPLSLCAWTHCPLLVPCAHHVFRRRSSPFNRCYACWLLRSCHTSRCSWFVAMCSSKHRLSDAHCGATLNGGE